MMRMRMNAANPPTSKSSDMPNAGAVVDWELRPGGMLVQKRNPDSDRDSALAPVVKVRVKYGSSMHEVFISSQATFGELKKQLSALTGLHPQDQKLLFKDKERDNTAYLDLSGVKNRSKIVLLEDPTSQERRYLEMRRNAKMEKAAKSVSEISLEVDNLAGQVSALESLISRGGKVAEKDVLSLSELLMTQLIKLDGIMADGDAKLQRRMQVSRVQKYVETLDLLKIKNATPNGNRQTAVPPSPAPPRQQSPAVLVTTKWETFDATPAAPPSTSTTNSKLNWEFFEETR
ncbi:BAG family molecular chaperone regulator 1 [Aristolochia californica]|uniref:BAG family molecular chaperone regulator 1 n=1 Tax=Aristolochia californica TaxID=171875 RepID=UPI0035D80B84